MSECVKCLVQGAQGVGKTTLVENIRGVVSKDFEVGCSFEVAKELIEKGIRKDMETRIEDYYAYFAEYLRHFKEHGERIVFFDRSVLDVIVFARMCLGRDSWVEKLGFEIFGLIKDEISCVFYIPIEFDIVEDGVRNINESERNFFDETLKDVMKEAGLSYITVEGGVDRRCERACREVYRRLGI